MEELGGAANVAEAQIMSGIADAAKVLSCCRLLETDATAARRILSQSKRGGSKRQRSDYSRSRDHHAPLHFALQIKLLRMLSSAMSSQSGY
jgi:hypothetical protein